MKNTKTIKTPEITITLEQAQNAYRGISFDPEKRGQQVMKDLQQTLAEFKAHFEEAAEKGGLHALAEEFFFKFWKGYQKRYSAWLDAKSRCLSWMITGPANFPSARNEKRNRTENRRYEELASYRAKVLPAMLRKLRPDLATIKNGDDDAIERLEAKLAAAEKWHAFCKTVNATLRKTKGKTLEDRVAALIEATGCGEKTAREYLAPNCFGYIGVESYRIAYNSRDIRELKKRIEYLKKTKACPVHRIEGPNADLEDDPPANRIRLYFPGIPAREGRQTLKKNGFRWAPSLGCWQAYRNNWSIQTAKQLAGLI